jgi:hypothetical protein
MILNLGIIKLIRLTSREALKHNFFKEYFETEKEVPNSSKGRESQSSKGRDSQTSSINQSQQSLPQVKELPISSHIKKQIEPVKNNQPASLMKRQSLEKPDESDNYSVSTTTSAGNISGKSNQIKPLRHHRSKPKINYQIKQVIFN